MSTLFSQTHHLLTLEGYLLQGCLKTGLNSLQQGHVGNKGAYYTAFLQLSIGIERLLKVILLIDHMARNDLAMPAIKTFKGYGHDLNKLYDAVKSLPDPSPNPLVAIELDSIPAKLVEFLAKFAKNTRYHNLDSLVGESTATDPLAEWHVIVLTIFHEDIPQASKKATLPQLATSALLMQNNVSVVGRNLDGSDSRSGCFCLFCPRDDF